MQKDANLIELDKCCQTHSFLQNFVLILPRTSPPKVCKILQKFAKALQKICKKFAKILANLELPTTKAGHEDAESERRLRPRRQAAPLAGLHEAAREDLGIQKLAFFQIGERALEGPKINVFERPGVGTDILQHSLADS